MKKISYMPGKVFHFALFFSLLSSCNQDENPFDATGTFEATEIMVASEVNGKILNFEANEGDILEKGQIIANIDVLPIQLQKEEVEATLQAINKKRVSAEPEIAVIKKQLKSAKNHICTLDAQMDVLLVEQRRVQNLYNSKAATSQQLDDINGKVIILKKQIQTAESQLDIYRTQIESARSKADIQNRAIYSEKDPLEKRIQVLDDQLKRGELANPSAGTMISKYAYAGEFITMGKSMYKLADLKRMKLRVYVTVDQLSSIKLGDKIAVFIDYGREDHREYAGVISWISDQAEFTPKTIQTKDERANLVYAIKVDVKNDGYLKIGMYGEVILHHTTPIE